MLKHLSVIVIPTVVQLKLLEESTFVPEDSWRTAPRSAKNARK